MREPTLKETAAVSVFLHALFFVFAFFVFKKSPHFTPPSPYIVSLVTPTEISNRVKGNKAKMPVAKIKEIKRKRREKMLKMKAEKKRSLKSKPKKVVSKKGLDSVSVEERIAAIKAKKRIEKIVELRRAVLSINKDEAQQQTTEAKPDQQAQPAGNGGDSIIGGYGDLVKKKIWSEWVYPEFKVSGNLLAIINIKIRKDGTVLIQGIERSSGNSLFDRSALRAIRKASPLPPPPFEMEIALRFTP